MCWYPGVPEGGIGREDVGEWSPPGADVGGPQPSGTQAETQGLQPHLDSFSCWLQAEASHSRDWKGNGKLLLDKRLARRR